MWTQICTTILNECERKMFKLFILDYFSSVTSYVSSLVIVPLYFYYTLHFYIYPKELFFTTSHTSFHSPHSLAPPLILLHEHAPMIRL